VIALAPALALLGTLTAGPGAGQGGACLPATPQPGPGVAEPFRAPAEAAAKLNADAKVLYRQGKWEEARAQYRAAEAADPQFLAPRLNVACSFVRQERFDEAVAEVKTLLERAYVPWSREVLEAADLGALKVQPQMAEVKKALAAGAAAWGAGLEESVIFVGRQRKPLHIPDAGSGEFILNPHQEVFAFTPATGRFRQLTAEDGHVVAVARSSDGRRIAYVTAQKFVRGDKAGLDGVAIRELTLATMTAGAPVPVPGPVAGLGVRSTSRGFVFEILGRVEGSFVIGSGGTMALIGRLPRRPAPVALSAHGTSPVSATTIEGSCPVSVRDVDAHGGGRSVVVSSRGRPPRTLGGTLGAGLAGLPLP
jgi:hypothetical protein